MLLLLNMHELHEPVPQGSHSDPPMSMYATSDTSFSSNLPVPLAVQYDHEQAEAGAGAEYNGGMFDNRSDGTGLGRGPALPRDEIRFGSCRGPAPPCATMRHYKWHSWA